MAESQQQRVKNLLKATIILHVAHIVRAHFFDGSDKFYYFIQFISHNVMVDESGSESISELIMEKQTILDLLTKISINTAQSWKLFH